MWGAALKGATYLDQRENCTYDPVFDIPESNCSGLAVMSGLLTEAGYRRGQCGDGGVCVCNEGYTGRSEWVNLDGLDCQASDEYLRFCVSIPALMCPFVILNSVRLIRKTYLSNRGSEREIKRQIRKAPVIAGFGFLVCNVPVLIYSLLKFSNPDLVLVDPSDNPLFFTFVMICLNGEWWSYSMIFTSLIDPIVRGIHNRSQRGKIAAAAKVSRLAKQVPVVDLITRVVVIVVPALCGGATNNASILIFTFWFRSMYGGAKFVLFIAIYLRTVLVILTTMEKKPTKNNTITGSTEQKLQQFVTKVKIAIGIVAFLLVGLFLKMTHDVFFTGNRYYGYFSGTFSSFRGWMALSQGLLLECLYLDLVPSFLRLCKRRQSNKKDYFSTVTGSFGITSKNEKDKGGDENGVFQLENPMRESQNKIPNTAL